MKKKIRGKKKDSADGSGLSGDDQSDIEDHVSKESLDNATRKRKKQKKVNFQ